MLPGHMSPRNEIPLVRFSGRKPLHTIVTLQLTTVYLTMKVALEFNHSRAPASHFDAG